MSKRVLFLNLVVILVSLMLSCAGSAQDLDLSGIDSDQLTNLLMLLQKTQAPAPTPTPTPAPAESSIPDITQLDSDQLALLMTLLQRMQENTVTETPTPTPAPTGTPLPVQLDNEQITMLLALLQQMQQGNEIVLDEGSETLAEGKPEKEPDSVLDENIFHIYKNKKLILERIPDDKFIPKSNGDEDKDGGKPGKKKDGKTCPSGCYYTCGYPYFNSTECGCQCSDG